MEKTKLRQQEDLNKLMQQHTLQPRPDTSKNPTPVEEVPNPHGHQGDHLERPETKYDSRAGSATATANGRFSAKGQRKWPEKYDQALF